MLPILTVSEFIDQVNGIIAGEFIVEGEISQFKISQGKWIFFDLKDSKAVVNCFATIFTIGNSFEDGMKVRVIGYPKVHEKSGRFSLTVQKVELVGEGSLKKAFLLLKEKLNQEGLFAAERKRLLPKMPQTIGVIASRDSAAWGDFWRILNNRWGGVEIHLYHTTVQGESAIGEITEAFEYFNKKDLNCELIVMIRGGGSMEDLAAFNSEIVARAVYGSRLPVVCGVGHERDETLADYVADVRASTPSNAAEIVVPDRRDFLSELDFTIQHIVGKLENKVARERHNVDRVFAYVSTKFEVPLQRGRMILERFLNTCQRLINRFDQVHDFVISSERFLGSMDPKRVLKRGFALVRDKKGKLVRHKTQIDIGDEMVVEFSDGQVDVEIMGKQNKAKQIKLF